MFTFAVTEVITITTTKSNLRVHKSRPRICQQLMHLSPWTWSTNPAIVYLMRYLGHVSPHLTVFVHIKSLTLSWGRRGQAHRAIIVMIVFTQSAKTKLHEHASRFPFHQDPDKAGCTLDYSPYDVLCFVPHQRQYHKARHRFRGRVMYFRQDAITSSEQTSWTITFSCLVPLDFLVFSSEKMNSLSNKPSAHTWTPWFGSDDPHQ